jgi:hypothetical protein
MARMPDINELLKRWPSLPDEAVVHVKVAAAVTGLSERTIRYDGRFRRVDLSANRYGIRVGDIRKVLAGGSWQQIGDVAERVVESCGADVRDTQRRLRAELDKGKAR